MSSGASHCLIHEIALALQTQGIERFNLGGADDPNGGLERFKAGFGTTPVELEAAEFSFSGPIRRAITQVVDGIKAMRSR
jgi:lipid II:glycine glycyltransferase (peptidoglycan interpeptide bridge formation enzyme)